jgi:hypothetical protein
MKIADEKARALLGPKMAAELKKIIEVAKDVTYDSEALAKGSARHNFNIAGMTMRLLGGVPDVAAEAITGARARAAGRAAAGFRPESVAAEGAKAQSLRSLIPVVYGAGMGGAP